MKELGQKIIESITNHVNAYSYLKIKTPSYRILDTEYMTLENYIIWNFPECKNKSGDIKSFMGVDLEIVKKGDF